MAAQQWVNDAGVARQIREVWVNDNGVARRILEIWVNDNGTARQIFVGDQITISNVLVDDLAISPTNAFAGYQLQNDGDIVVTQGALTTDIGDWIAPRINMALYECRATVTSGSLTSGTTGVWLNLGATRSWSLSKGNIGTATATMTLEIRRASDSVVMDTATISFQATKEF